MSEPLPEILLDPQATEACVNVNKEALKIKEVGFLDCSLRTEYKRVVGEEKQVTAEGNTFCKWHGSAQNLILYSLIDGVENNTLHSTHPLLEQDTNQVGMNFVAHPHFENCFQIVYVQQKVNSVE